MKCFYHGNLDAVATCQRCGKGLCHECAGRYSPCMCNDCAEILIAEQEEMVVLEEETKRQKYLDALIDTKKEFFKACIYGVLVVLCFKMPELGWGNGLLFFVPFGWKLLTYLQSMTSIFLVGNLAFWVAWLLFKVVLSIFVGVPAFFYQLVRTFFVQKKIDDFQRKDGEKRN